MSIKRTALPTAVLGLVLLISALGGMQPGPTLGNAEPGLIEATGVPVMVVAKSGNTQPIYGPPPHPQHGPQAPTANIVVNYSGTWDPQAQAAFDYAVGIWEGLISSPVPIIVDAYWEPLPTGVLGSSGPTRFFANFQGAPQSNTLYPVALANKMYGSDLSGLADIQASFNSNFSISGSSGWYFGTDGQTPLNRWDLVSVVLHELGHGLGFIGTMDANNSNHTASWGWSGLPAIFDRFAENGSGASLLVYASGSTDLYNQLTSGNIYFDGPAANAANSGTPAKLYAPSSWSGGSSYAHLDETFNNTPNALMTWSLLNGEAQHSPGPVTLGIIADIGWSLSGPQNTPTLTLTPTATYTPTWTPTATPTVTPLTSPASYAYLPGTYKNYARPTFTPTPTATTTPIPTLSPGTGIYGRVTVNGSAMPGIPLSLRRYDSSLDQWSTIASQNTDLSGRFDFSGLPTLESGDIYTVIYLNQSSNNERLYLWVTPYIRNYTSGSAIEAGEFDIADVILQGPGDDASVSLPTTFYWSRRPHTTSDRYVFHLLDQATSTAEYFSSSLGYANFYTLTGLPAGFVANQLYAWEVLVYPPGGGYPDQGWGLSFDFRYITFTSVQQNSAEQPLQSSSQEIPIDPITQR
jgi:hypothetical protein